MILEINGYIFWGNENIYVLFRQKTEFQIMDTGDMYRNNSVLTN